MVLYDLFTELSRVCLILICQYLYVMKYFEVSLAKRPLTELQRCNKRYLAVGWTFIRILQKLRYENLWIFKLDFDCS